MIGDNYQYWFAHKKQCRRKCDNIVTRKSIQCFVSSAPLVALVTNYEWYSMQISFWNSAFLHRILNEILSNLLKWNGFLELSERMPVLCVEEVLQREYLIEQLSVLYIVKFSRDFWMLFLCHNQSNWEWSWTWVSNRIS